MGQYMGTSEAAKKWGHTQAQISRLCREGKIKGAEQDAKELNEKQEESIKEEESPKEPEKDEEAIYTEFCQMVDDGKYTDALEFKERKELREDYADTKDYYYYAKAMKLYIETEFLLYQDLLDVVKILSEDVSDGFKDSEEIVKKNSDELKSLVGKHIYKRGSRYAYDAYILIIDNDGKVVVGIGKSKDGYPEIPFDYQLAYVNLEKGSYYMLCTDYSFSTIDDCTYAITISSNYITLSRAWGNTDAGLCAHNYSRVS